MPPEVISKLVETGILGALLVGAVMLLVWQVLAQEKRNAAHAAALKAESDARLSDAKAYTEALVSMQRETTTAANRLADAVEMVASKGRAFPGRGGE